MSELSSSLPQKYDARPCGLFSRKFPKQKKEMEEAHDDDVDDERKMM